MNHPKTSQISRTHLPRTYISIALLALALPRAILAADPATGWRGDGTGKYPAVNPPTLWSRTSAAVEGLRFVAKKPADTEMGTAMPDGVIREWLIAGPIPLIKQGDEELALPDEAALAPEEGQPAADRKWQKVTLDSAYLDFNRLLGKPKDQAVAAYAFTNIYSPTGGAFRLNLTYINAAALYLNGKKPAAIGNRMSLDLARGWNRLLLRVSPGETDWYAVPVFHARGRAQFHETNIAWHTPLPGAQPGFYGGGSGAGSAVIIGDKLYLQSEPHDLICLNKADGKVLWIRRAGYFEAATDAEKKLPAYQDAQELSAKIDAINAAFIAGKASPAQLEQKAKLEKDLLKQMKGIDRKKYASDVIPDVGFSGYTPSTDGQFIYAWFGDGVSACFSPDGTRRWIRVDQRPAVEHGFSSSPLLIDGKFVVFMRDLLAFDCDTGKLAWQTQIVSHEGVNPANFIHGSMAAATIGQTKLIVLGNGTILRAGDGRIIYQDTKIDTQAVPSPVVEGHRIFHMSAQNAELAIRTLPDVLTEPLQLKTQRIRIDTFAFPRHYLPWHLSSPLIHEGLAYLMNNAGVLTVLDIETGQVIYQKLLDLDPLQAHNEGSARGQGTSPALAGNHISFLGNNGAALVIEPGRVYKQLAKNKLERIALPTHWSERQERFVANPIFDGDRLYIRGEDALYAIGH